MKPPFQARVLFFFFFSYLNRIRTNGTVRYVLKTEMIHNFLLQRIPFHSECFGLFLHCSLLADALSPKDAKDSLLQMIAFWEIGECLKNLKAF